MNRPGHIMVVDDEESMRVLLKDFLESQGYDVSCHASGAAALKALAQGKQFDAIVADIRMSPLSGIELLKIVKRNSPSLPVVLFTAAGNPDEKAQSLKIGAAGYLAKPFPLTELKLSLERVLARTPGPKGSSEA